VAGWLTINEENILNEDMEEKSIALAGLSAFVSEETVVVKTKKNKLTTQQKIFHLSVCE